MKKNFVSLLLGALMITNCTTINGKNYCLPSITPIEKVNKAELEQAFKEIAREICVVPTEQAVIIPDFLEIQSLNTNVIGLLLGEIMRSSYSQLCKNKIIQVEFPKYFKITKDGVLSLSRRPEEIKKIEHNVNVAIIGTYSYTSDIIRIFVRKIDVETGYILKMTSKEIVLPVCRNF